MDIKTAIAKAVDNQDMTILDMENVMRQIMTGESTPAQIAALLVALRMKGETVDELTASASVMRELVTPVKVEGQHVIDIVGTGGDGLHTFNVSTTSCFVVAAAGATVAKHGNRSVSSTSGSADILEAAGINLNISSAHVEQCIKELGVGFMFAPLHHSAMKYAIGPRKEMAIRTMFNLLGPLTNPAGAPNQLLGVFARQWLEPLAKVLKNLGSDHVMVVHSADGMDEISMVGETYVCELNKGEISHYTITPEQFGLTRSSIDSIIVNGAEESLIMVQSVLDDKPGAARDIVTLNSGAAIYCAGLTQTLEEGVDKAKQAITSGAAKEKLTQLAKLTQSFAV
ncbi:MAG: anthranilate phosphoribosyltransferase [gamma proteobacterium symbiont of Bathyaustriella thionipta]|nr:anthranilate phosphoribosyltransferase [gamma proteobacterium symbiont of Bathyaustriella thionipta]MCU7948918.1 anthranilate phosphoribosyltransferase [gamma proteobacterium symbiont of Bathyaustriella thionipta]MCU7954307.1 anthranilate phosphoribosyltransferase [gamma proteobacterium symbiont of Bathyaustriella thionipta]MCU7955625.1 anthranilate phosphoribosyltransferase [gamma proteobacterium symbiont of Bathyaustriella thionipta]MCU7966641.1 anthranilate phosphoribosyltransferase [gamm